MCLSYKKVFEKREKIKKFRDRMKFNGENSKWFTQKKKSNVQIYDGGFLSTCIGKKVLGIGINNKLNVRQYCNAAAKQVNAI